MTIKNLMLSTAILAAVSGGAFAQTETETVDPAAPAEDSGALAVPAENNENMGVEGADVAEAQPHSIEEMTVGEFLGTPVISGDGEDVGEIDYVIQTADGPAAVIGIGGFLGLGEYTVALPLSDFSYNPEQVALTVGLSKEELESIPEFEESDAESLPDETLMADLMQSEQPAASTADAGGAEVTGESTDMAETEQTDMAATESETELEEGAEDAAAATGAAVDEAADATENAANEAGEAVENTAEDVADATGDAVEATGDAAENAGEEVADAANDATNAVDNAAEEAGDEMAEAGDEASEAADDAAATDVAESAEPKSFESMAVSEAIGTRVQNDAGEDIGELEYVVMHNDKTLEAVIGVGGFLGMGEHDVALPLDSLTYDEEQKILKVSMTEDELRNAPQFDEASASDAEKLSKDTIIGDAMNGEASSN